MPFKFSFFANNLLFQTKYASDFQKKFPLFNYDDFDPRAKGWDDEALNLQGHRPSIK